MARIRFDKLLDYWTPQMRRAFFQAVQNVKSLSQIGQLERAIAAGDVEAALRAVDLNPVNFRPIDSTIYSAFEAGGNATAAGFPTLGVPGGLRVVFQFNVRNPVAEQWLAQYSSNLITAIIDDQKQMIRQNLVRAMAAGTNPRTAALDLVGRIGPSGVREGGVIGLTQTQEQWVANYGEALMSNNPRTALGYLMRDRRFDSSVINAAEGGEPLTADQIQAMMDSYANRALLYRGETIARTEMLTSLHESQQQAMQQAVDQGLIRKDAVAYVWRTARDLRVRDQHVALEGQTQKMGDYFIDGDGNFLLYPGDPSAPPETVINCRCTLEVAVDFLAGVQ